MISARCEALKNAAFIVFHHRPRKFAFKRSRTRDPQRPRIVTPGIFRCLDRVRVGRAAGHHRSRRIPVGHHAREVNPLSKSRALAGLQFALRLFIHSPPGRTRPVAGFVSIPTPAVADPLAGLDQPMAAGAFRGETRNHGKTLPDFKENAFIWPRALDRRKALMMMPAISGSSRRSRPHKPGWSFPWTSQRLLAANGQRAPATSRASDARSL